MFCQGKVQGSACFRKNVLIIIFLFHYTFQYNFMQNDQLTQGSDICLVICFSLYLTLLHSERPKLHKTSECNRAKNTLPVLLVWVYL